MYLVLAFQDTTLLILLAAAAVSLGIGLYEHPDTGYIEGLAIFIAVFLVAFISAGNDYSKEIQFKALEASSADDERASALRDGVIERINPRDLVVGDIMVLQAGDKINADAILIDSNVVLANESGLTGEPDDLKKSKTGDPFLLSSCLITEGNQCLGVIIGIGTRSQWGKIKANLVSEPVNTPLQDKLEDMTNAVRKEDRKLVFYNNFIEVNILKYLFLIILRSVMLVLLLRSALLRRRLFGSSL
jgi:magnesium-transporting ATPase (P-type)